MHDQHMKPRGQVYGILRNAETLEEEGRIPLQDNIVLDLAFYVFCQVSNSFLMPDGTGLSVGTCAFPGGIAVTTRRQSPSRTNWKIPGGDSGIVDTTAWGNPIPSVPSPTFFPTNGGTQQYTEWATRIPVPGANMEISTIMLTDGSAGNTSEAANISQHGNSFVRVYAYSKLSSPCLQTTSQVLDVYYRVQFPSPSYVSLQYSNLVAQLLSATQGGNQQAGLCSQAYPTVLPMPVVKAADLASVQYSPFFFQAPRLAAAGGPTYEPVFSLFKIKFNNTLQQTDATGSIIGGISQGVENPQAVTASSPYVTNYVQNVFGHSATSTIPFLDIDGLATGTGHFVPSGTWTYKNAPANTGQYYSGNWPKLWDINIVSTGAVGASSYTYDKRVFFGYGVGTYAFGDYCLQAQVCVQPLCMSAAVPGAIPAINTLTAAAYPAMYTGLLGDMTKFSVEQMTSMVAYDSVSVVIPKANQIMLYNLACSDYWYYTGAFTDITQVAVVNGLIYAACRNTGLWVINPVTGTVTNTTTPAAGIDLSIANGVCKGYNNSVWVLGNNGLAHYDGTSTWTLYNSTTTPALTMTGISDNNWGNVSYIKSNHSNANGEMMLVLKPNATVNPTILGCWWSLAGAASLTGVDMAVTNNNNYGAPKTNRTHLACSPNQGVWVVHYSNAFYALPFGTTTSTLLTGVSGQYNNDNSNFDSLNSISFVQGPGGGDRLLTFSISNMVPNNSTGGYGGRASAYLLKLDGSGLDVALSDSTSPANSMTVPWNNYAGTLSTQNSNNYAGYGYHDMGCTVNMGNGVLFEMFAANTNAGLAWGNNSASVCSFLYNYAINDSVQGGGPLAYIGKQSFGWSGSAWVAGSTTGKPTHTAVNTLDEGLSIAFVDGGSGTSFVTSEYYNFGVCAGKLKDNATTLTLEDNFYIKKAYVSATDISTATIPTANNGATGLAGINAARSNSTDTTLDSNNNTVFLDQNGNQFSIGTIDLIGNFQVSYAWDPTNTNMVCIDFGIGYASRASTQYFFRIDESNNLNIVYPTSSAAVLNADNTSNTYNSTGVMAASAVTSLAITRTGNQINFIVNGSPFTYGNGNVQPGSAQTRFNLICSPKDVVAAALNTANRTCPAATVVANGTDNAIQVGIAANSTGYFNPLFAGVDTDARGGITATIAGVAVTAVHVDGSAPGQGEISVDPWMGTIVFNTADQGKTYAQTCTYITHE